MAQVSPLCSRNARSQKTLVGRAQWGTHLGHLGETSTSKLGKLLLATRCGLADSLFEHPANEPHVVPWINPENFLSD